MKIVDLNIFKQEDFLIQTPAGNEYKIDGNFSTEFFITLYDSYQKVQSVIKTDVRAATQMMREIVLEILKLDPSKEVTTETLREENIDNFQMLQAVLTATMQQANEAANSKNSESPTSK